MAQELTLYWQAAVKQMLELRSMIENDGSLEDTVKTMMLSRLQNLWENVRNERDTLLKGK